jgi:hypothetical protein
MISSEIDFRTRRIGLSGHIPSNAPVFDVVVPSRT